MKDVLKNLGDFLSLKHLIVANVLFFLALKFIIPMSMSELAIISGPVTPFDSRDIIAETNKARKIEQLPPLKADSRLDVAAQEKLEDMVKNSYFAHVSPSGVNPWYWISDAGYRYTYAGENLALGYTTAPETVQAWLNSPGHRANLLNTNYSDIGVAVANTSINGISGVLVVQTFGNQLIAPVKPKIEISVAKAIPPTPVPVVNLVSGAVLEPPQEISTDKTVRLVNETLSTKEAPVAVSGFFDDLSKGYAIYLAIFMSALVIAGIMHGFKKTSVISIGASFALLILMVFVPSVESVVHVAIF